MTTSPTTVSPKPDAVVEPTRSGEVSTEPRSGPESERGWAPEPLDPPAEGIARSAARRARSDWKAPVLVAVAAYVGVAVVLLVAGWLLVHTPAGDAVRSWDETVSRDLSVTRTSGWSDYSEVGTSGANTMPVLAGMVLVTVVLAALRRWRDMMLVPLGLVIELSTFLTVNYLVARERPDVAQLGGEPGTHSFPSGHVAATFVLWFGIALLLGANRWRTPWRLLAWALAAIPVLTVAFSRVYRGMHFTTDVLTGLALGAVALAAAAVATRSSWLAADAGHATGRTDTDRSRRVAGAGVDR